VDHPTDTSAATQVIKRARQARLIMLGGLGILAITLVWIVWNRSVKPPMQPAIHQLELPEGTRILSTALDGERMALTVEGRAGISILVIRILDGSLIARIDVRPELPGQRPVAQN
jgi:hypothetical protein